MNVQLSLDKMMMDRSDLSARQHQSADGKRFDDIISDKDFAAPRVPDRDRQHETTVNEPEKNSKEKVWTKARENQKDDGKKAKPVTQRDAMEIFLQKMENEVGVKPEEVLQAFAELSINELVAPPEESATKVIDKLDLDGGKQSKAMQLYNEMLAMTAAASMANYLNNSGQQAHVQVLNKREAQLKDLRTSLDVMSQKFFLNGEEGNAVRANAAQAKAQALNIQGTNDTEAIVVPTAVESQMPTMEIVESAGLPQMPSAKLPLADTMDVVENINGEPIQVIDNDLMQVLQEISETEELPPEIKVLFEKQKAVAYQETAVKPVNSGMVTTSQSIPDAQVEAFDTVASALERDFQGQSSTDSESSGENLDQDSTALIERLGLNQNAKTATKADFVLAADKVSTADVQNNIKEIISQAQFLSRRGGGEMKVALSPEGLGQVNIRVVSENGQIHVEMVASNDEAKKLLEKGLVELRENLAQHKLSLESIKIDASKDLASQLADQQQNLEQNAQHKFLNDFRERNFAMKRELFEYGNPKLAGSQTRDEAMNTDETAKRRRDSSRRLDLVA